MPAPETAPHTAGADERAETLHELVLRSLDDDKAVDVVSIPLGGKSNIADYMVIASGRSSRQVAAMAQKLSERIKRDLGVLWSHLPEGSLHHDPNAYLKAESLSIPMAVT